MSYNPYELYHHGILGQKWGIRRFQNKDGSLKAEGKKRYSSDQDKTEKKTETQEQRAARRDKARASRSAAEIYKNADAFSDQELRDAYNRLQTEKNIKDMIPKTVSKGEAAYNKVMSFAEKTSNAIEKGSNLYNSVTKVYNMLNPDKPRRLINAEDTNERIFRTKKEQAEKAAKDSAKNKKKQELSDANKSRITEATAREAEAKAAAAEANARKASAEANTAKYNSYKAGNEAYRSAQEARASGSTESGNRRKTAEEYASKHFSESVPNRDSSTVKRGENKVNDIIDSYAISVRDVDYRYNRKRLT